MCLYYASLVPQVPQLPKSFFFTFFFTPQALFGKFQFLEFFSTMHGLSLTKPTKYCSGLPLFLKTQICDVLKNGFPAYQHLPSSFFCRMTNRTNCQQHVTIPYTMTSEQFCFESKQKVKEKMS